VGSTVNFPKRQKEHFRGKGDLEFQRSLRKKHDNFYWIVSENDGLETRDEEQYYLDFYCGSVWCYNHNPSAKNPPSNLGSKRPEHAAFMRKWNIENHPQKGKPVSIETKEKIKKKLTGRKRPEHGEILKGRKKPEHSKLISSLKWFVNAEGECVRKVKTPGKKWQPGRKWREP
jgi:hypothetical protein